MSRKISQKNVHVAISGAALLFAFALTQACGSSSGGAFGAGGTSGDTSLAGASASGGTLSLLPGAGGSSSQGGATTSSNGANGGASLGGSTACTGPNCGITGPGQPSGSICTMPDECASGRCEPVTGQPMEACLAACFSDGVACTRALDCCSTGCLNGTCGGQCSVVGDPCKTNAECCSNVCEAGQCQVDMPNRDCRPTGEDCGKGSGSGCCNTCNKEGRCDFGPDTCFAQGVACTSTAQCCHGECTGGKCVTPCVAQAGACTANGDCCSVSCVAGQCAPPPTIGGGGASGVGGGSAVGGGATTCTLTGDACTDATTCCSGVCFGGFCEAPVR